MTQSTVVTDSDANTSTTISVVTATRNLAAETKYGPKIEEFHQMKTNNGFVDLVNNWKDAIKPWSSFFNLRAFGLPIPLKQLPKRIKMNISNFAANYIVIMLLLSFCCIITSFWLLISVIILTILFAFIRSKTAKKPLTIGGEKFPSWLLYSAAVFCVIPLLILANVGYLLYCAVGTSILLILIHATFYSGIAPIQTTNKNNIPQVTVSGTAKTTESKELLQKTTESADVNPTHNPKVTFSEENPV